MKTYIQAVQCRLLPTQTCQVSTWIILLVPDNSSRHDFTDLVKYIDIFYVYVIFSSYVTLHDKYYLHFTHSFICFFIHQWLYSLLLDPGLFFRFVIFFTHKVELLGEWSGRRKAATYTQDGTNTE
jgi:hypothetical protein